MCCCAAEMLYDCFYNFTACRLHIKWLFVYFFLRCDVSQGEWVRCNVHTQKMCHYPVFGLKEGTLYQFRVRAVNQAGASRPSKATEPVLTADPLEHTRTTGNTKHTVKETQICDKLKKKSSTTCSVLFKQAGQSQGV